MSETRQEKALRHLTWPELRERYAAAETFEERLGLIHATRGAVIVDDAPEDWMRELQATRDGVAFLTNIGDEFGPLFDEPPSPEPEHQLRREARIVLARYFVKDWIPDQCVEPRPERERDRDPGDIVGSGGGWGASPGSELRREIVSRLLRFYRICAQHCDGLDDKSKARVRNFIRTRWEWQRSNECQFIPRDQLLLATERIGAYEFFSRYGALDAIPLLYKNIVCTLNDARRRWRYLQRTKEIRGGEDTHIALMACAEALDLYGLCRHEPGVEYARRQARVLLELLAQHERKGEHPNLRTPTVVR